MTYTDYYLQHPKNQLFYKILSHASSIMNTRCTSWWGYPIPRGISWFYELNNFMVIYFSKVIFISQTLFLILNYKTVDAEELGVAMSITPLGFLISVKSQVGKFESLKDVMKNFMDKIHIYNSYLRNQSSKYIKTKVIQVERLTRFTAYFLGICLMICLTAFVLQPTLYNIRNIDAIMNKTKHFHYYIYIWVPIDYKYNLKNFICLHVIHIYIGMNAICIVTTFDSINLMFIYHFVGHFHILKYNLREIWSNEFDEQETRQYLIDIIKYHSFLMRTFKNIQAAFSVNISAIYLQNLIEDGLLLYQLLIGDKEYIIIYGCMLLVYLGGLIIISIVLEEIRRQNDNISGYVYALPWQNMSISNKKIFILLLARTQPDLEFRAACGMKAGVQPAISIIKSMFSYYVMIKSRM